MSLDLPLLISRSRLLGSVASSAPRLLNMITKPENLARRTKSFHLSCLDQNIVRVYIQTLCIFPFPDQNNAEAAIHALGNGIRLSLKKFPFLAGLLSLPDASTGRLALEYPIEVSDEELNCIFRSKQIPFHERDFPYTYEQLKRDGMPPSAFKGSMFVPEDLANYPGVPKDGEGKVDFEKSDAPAMRCQAFFIPGGLVLSTYMHHSVSDFSGINLFWETLSTNVTNLPRQYLISDSKIFDTISVADRQSRLRQAVDWHINPQQTGGGGGAAADCYCDGPPTYRRTLPADTACAQRLFVIPVARIRRYQDMLRPHFPPDSTPTMCNVLAALVWTHVTRARGDRLLQHGLNETNLGIATDLRKRQNPCVPADYTGNMALFSKATLNVSDLLIENRVTLPTIIRVITEIQTAILGVDDTWVSRHLKFFKSIAQITDTEISLGSAFGSDMYISSWLNFGADLSWGIPGTDQGKHSLAGRPEFIRRTYAPSDGGIIFLPRRRQLVNGTEAPFEILVRLAKEDMARVLDEEGGLRSWADAVLE